MYTDPRLPIDRQDVDDEVMSEDEFEELLSECEEYDETK